MYPVSIASSTLEFAERHERADVSQSEGDCKAPVQESRSLMVFFLFLERRHFEQSIQSLYGRNSMLTPQSNPRALSTARQPASRSIYIS